VTKLKKLEEITHPAVQFELANRLKNLPAETIVIYEIPLLIEKNLMTNFDQTIAVIADLKIRKERALARGISGADFQARIANQTTDQIRKESVDHIIYNNGTLAELADQVARTWAALTT